MSEVIPSSSLDARGLLVHSSKDTFYSKNHEIQGETVMFWWILDAYLQNLEPISGFNDDELVPLEKHTPEYRETRKQLFRTIYREPGFDINKIDTIQIDKSGILILNYKNGSNFTINIIESWNSILLKRPSNLPIERKTQELTKSLEKDIHTESYLDGSVLISYIPATATIAAGTHSMYRLLWNTKNTMEVMIEKIMIKNTTTGKMERVSLWEIYRGTKESISQNLIKILEKVWYIHSPKDGWFYSPYERALWETKNTLQKLSYEDYIKERSQNTLTRDQFDGMKNDVLHKIEWVSSTKTLWADRISSLIKMLGRNAGELIFLPVFFRHFGQYQNTATAAQWIAEMWLFTSWAKLWSKIPIPWIGKFLTPLVGGWAFVIAGTWWASELDANRKKWQYLYNKWFGSLYTNGKSTTGHFVGNLWVFNMNEYMDIINKGWQKIADITGIKSEDIDIGFPRVEMPLPWWKYKWTFPEMNLFQSTVNFGTSPWDWTRWAVGRDIDDWNKKVDLYRESLKRKIWEIIWKYVRNESMFASESEIKKYWSKENLLKVHLLDILWWWWESSAFESEKWEMINSLVSYLDWKKPQDIKIKTINEIISNRISQMYVDSFFVDKRQEMLNIQRWPLWFELLIPQITKNPAWQKYIWSLLQRMNDEKPLFEPGKWEKNNVLWMTSNKWIPTKEWEIFQGLLENTSEISIQFPKFSGKTTVWNAFSMFLDMLLEHKRESEFLREIQKWNKKWVEWKL